MTDVVVVGAGTMGAWTALEAARDGRHVTLLDAFGAGHPRATSGDETRIIRSSHGSDALLPRWARASRAAWQDLGEQSGEVLYVECGAAWFAGRADGFEAASIDTLRHLGIPCERLSPAEIGARWPQVGLDGVAFAAWEPEAGLLMARRGVAAAVRAARAAGARFELAVVRPGTERGDRLFDVVASDGARTAGDLFVFACGPWLPAIFGDVLGDVIRVTKQDVLWFGPPAGDGRFAAEHLPSFVDYDAGFYGIPAVDGRGVKVAPDRFGPPFDPTSGDRLVDDESVDLTRRFLHRRFPALADQPVVETRVCQYESTLDTQFVLDRHPRYSNVWLAGGGSGHGFKHGPAIGRYVVGLLDGHVPTDEERRFAIDPPRRPVAGMRTGAGTEPYRVDAEATA